jgi:hypothetical protein
MREVRVGQGQREGGGHGVQPDGGWSACTGVKASPESGASRNLRGERGRVSGCTPDDQRPVGPIGPHGEREEAGCPRGNGLQQGRPGHAVERVPEVQLNGHVPGAARQARPQGVADASATPRVADSELQGGEGRTSVLAGGHHAEARKADPHLADGDRAHATAPRLYKSDEGRRRGERGCREGCR